MQITFAERVIEFNQSLEFNDPLPKGISIMNPFKQNDQILPISSAFYRKYYSDNDPRHLIMGINPGRFGSGLTGIPFTDPKHVTRNCGIPYHGPMAHEPSSVFVYEMIKAFGGEEAFYRRFYIGAVCPLGFTKLMPALSSSLSPNLSSSEGHESVFLNNHPPKPREVNYNYYDSRELTHAVYDFMVESLQTQLAFGINTDICFCFGTGKNEKFLRELNGSYHFFNRIVALEHPRYIMQYKAKTKQAYIDKYIRAFGEIG